MIPPPGRGSHRHLKRLRAVADALRGGFAQREHEIGVRWCRTAKTHRIVVPESVPALPEQRMPDGRGQRISHADGRAGGNTRRSRTGGLARNGPVAVERAMINLVAPTFQKDRPAKSMSTGGERWWKARRISRATAQDHVIGEDARRGPQRAEFVLIDRSAASAAADGIIGGPRRALGKIIRQHAPLQRQVTRVPDGTAEPADQAHIFQDQPAAGGDGDERTSILTIKRDRCAGGFQRHRGAGRDSEYLRKHDGAAAGQGVDTARRHGIADRQKVAIHRSGAGTDAEAAHGQTERRSD